MIKRLVCKYEVVIILWRRPLNVLAVCMPYKIKKYHGVHGAEKQPKNGERLAMQMNIFCIPP